MQNIHELARQGNLKDLLQQLANSQDSNLINQPDSSGKSILYLAASHGQHLLIVPLLNTGADPYQTGGKEHKTPLHAAAEKGHWETVKALVEAGVDYLIPLSQGKYEGWLAIHAAAARERRLLWAELQPDANYPLGYLKIIDFFLDKGISIDTPICFRDRKKHQGEIVHTPLSLAIRNKRMEIVNHLILRKVDLNKVLNREGSSTITTPLCEAVFTGDLTMVNYLLERGADLHRMARNKERLTPPLLIACEHGYTPIVQSLLAAGAQPNVIYQDILFTQISPLIRACMHSDQGKGESNGAVDLLLKANADFYTPLNLGRQYGTTTALFVAIINSQWQTVNLLLNQGAGIGVDLDQLPNQKEIEAKHRNFKGQRTWEQQLVEFLTKVNTHGVVIGLKVQGQLVSRNLPGFTNAITQSAELRAALRANQSDLNSAVLLKVVRTQLRLQPQSSLLRQVQNLLLLFHSNGLKQTCLEFINSKLDYRQLALQANLPEELREQIEPVK